MSWRYKGGFIQEFFNPLTVGPLQSTLYSWGLNVTGQLAQNNRTNLSSPSLVGDLLDWSNISSATDHSLFTKSNGTLWAVGSGDSGQLGQNDKVYRSSPVQVGALTTWLTLASGRYSSFAIKTDGSLWSFGRNGRGQLALDSIAYRSSPVQVGSGTTWLSVGMKGYHAVAVKTDGTLWSWGSNLYGQLGLGLPNSTYKSSPTQVGSQTTWLSSSCGSYHSLALKTDGTLWSWGFNDSGQLGTNNVYIDRSSPVQIGSLTTWSVIACGTNNCFAIKTDGTLWSWGANNSGRLGINNLSYRSSPVQIGSLTNWSKISAGEASFAIKTDGTLWSWGSSSFGANGQNGVARSSPVQIGTNTNWSKISSGGYAALATQSV